MAKGYTSIKTVSLALGKTDGAGASTLTSDQQTYAASLIDAAEAYIDRACNRAWLTGRIANELHQLMQPTIYLKNRPVRLVDVVQTRTTSIGDTWTALTAGVDYELMDSRLGRIDFVSGVGRNSMAQVSYLPNNPVPADIAQAAIEIVVASIYRTLNPDRWGVKELDVEAQAAITYSVDGMQIVVPELTQKTLEGYRMRIIA